MKETITVEKEVYEAVLRNSVRVNDLEVENQQLKELLIYCRNLLDVEGYENLVKEIDNAIGEEK